MKPLLEVKNLCAYFFMRSSTLKAVDGVSFEIQPGEIVGLVGESGCGKTTAIQCILRLLPSPGRIVEGEIHFDDKDLLALSPEEMRPCGSNSMPPTPNWTWHICLRCSLNMRIDFACGEERTDP